MVVFFCDDDDDDDGLLKRTGNPSSTDITELAVSRSFADANPEEEGGCQLI